MEDQRFISPKEAARLTGKTEQHITRLLRNATLPGQKTRRGSMTYWEIDSHSHQFKAILTDLPEAVQSMPVKMQVDWEEWEYLVSSGLGALVSKPLSKRSVHEYRMTLRRYFAQYDAISVRNMHSAYRKYLDSATEDTDYFTARKHIYYSIMSVVKYYRYKGLVSDAFVEEIRKERPRRTIQPQSQISHSSNTITALLAAVEGNKRYSTYEQVLNKLLILLGYITCLRNTEMRRLRLTDVDFDGSKHIQGEPSLFVHRGKGRKSRIVPLPGILAEAIRSYLQVRPAVDDPSLLLTDRGTPYCAKILAGKFQRIGRLANIHLTAHVLRRTGATILAKDKGVSIGIVSELLGHTDLRTTTLYVKDSPRSVLATLNNVW